MLFQRSVVVAGKCMMGIVWVLELHIGDKAHTDLKWQVAALCVT